MSLKKSILKQGMKLMSDPRILKLMQDERVMKWLMVGISLPGRVQSYTEEQRATLTKRLGIASEKEIQDLQRMVRSLEEQLADIKKAEPPARGNRHRNLQVVFQRVSFGG